MWEYTRFFGRGIGWGWGGCGRRRGKLGLRGKSVGVAPDIVHVSRLSVKLITAKCYPVQDTLRLGLVTEFFSCSSDNSQTSTGFNTFLQHSGQRYPYWMSSGFWIFELFFCKEMSTVTLKTKFSSILLFKMIDTNWGFCDFLFHENNNMLVLFWPSLAEHPSEFSTFGGFIRTGIFIPKSCYFQKWNQFILLSHPLRSNGEGKSCSGGGDCSAFWRFLVYIIW